jgi:hypothetical protein
MSIEDNLKYKYDYIQDASYQKHLKEKIGSEKRVFETGSQRDDDTDKPLVNHLTAYVRLRFGYLLREGANKYGKNNWQKGQPTETALESLHRHLAKYELGDRSEDHLSAIIFNVQLIMKNEEQAGIKIDEYYKEK